MRKRRWKIVGYVVVIAALASVIVYSFLPQPVAVETQLVERGSIQVTVEEDGKTRIRDKYVISSPLGGQLARVQLKAGDAVRAGETILTTLDPSPPALLDARSRAEAEARVKSAEASLERAEPLLKLALENVRIASEEFARQEKLYAGKAVSHEDRDQAEHRLLAAREEQRAAQYAQQIAGYELELARAALLHSRRQEKPGEPGQASGENDEWRIALRSPINGRVLRVLRESAAVVTAGEPLMEVGDPTDLEVVVDVLSSDAVRIAPCDEAYLDGWGGEQPLRAHVRHVEPSGFTKISALGVEEQRVNVVLDLDTPPADRPTLGDDFRVEARIVIDEASSVVKVPIGSLFRQAGRWLVYLVHGGRIELRAVEIGRRGRFEAEVVSGLAPGDRVVVYPSDQVRVGVRIVGESRRDSPAAVVPGSPPTAD